MSIENPEQPAEGETSLDDFSKEFFGNGKEKTPEEPVEEVLEKEEPEGTQVEDSDEDTQLDETDTLAEEDEPETEEQEEKPVRKKKDRFQERIDQLTSKNRETERKLLEALEKLNKAEERKTEPAPATVQTTSDVKEPSPDDTNPDGTDKYPLGEMDPGFIRDLTKHTLRVEREALKALEAEERAQLQRDQQRAELEAGWRKKLGTAQERYPDLHERGESLVSKFEGISQEYGEFLTSTIMDMDYGVDVLYHLASNPDLAQKIVDSGPAKAAIALGRIEAKFEEADQERQKARIKVSKAPTPAAHLNKGSAPGKGIDMDDLDQFSKVFFKKK